MVTYSTRLSDVEWGEFLKLLGGNSNTSSQNTNGTSPSGNNSTYSNNSQQIAYLDELTNIQSRLNRGLEDLILDINQKRSDIKKQYQTYEKDEKDIAKKKKDLERALTQNERANNKLHDSKYKEFLDTRNKQIRAELSLLNETEKYNKTKAKLYYKELETDATRTRIREKNYTHEQELEQKRLEFQEKHLEKTQAIAKKELEVQQAKQEWELKGYKKSGKKHSGAEIFSAIGKASAYFKGNSGDRIAGDAISNVTNLGAKTASFINAGKMDVGALADKMTGALSKAGPWGAASGGIIQILKTAFDMYSKVNTAASKFARTVGGGAGTIQRMEFSMAKVAKEISTSGDKWVSWNQRAYDAAKLLESAAEYSTAIGRTTEYLSKADFKALQDLKDYGIGFDIVSQFDTFGISAGEVSEKLANLYGTAGKHGLNAKAVSDTVTKNLKMAQQYTFAGGVRALERMAEKAVMLKYNMESVSRFTEKVSTLEGAVQSAAGLSVLGGNFARMANPLSMLYGGLQDPERLNEMMLNMTKGMAQWDSKKGQFDMAGVDRMRLRAAAENMGVDFNDLYNMAINQTRQQMVDKEIQGNVDEETRKYIRNIATIKDGKAVVSLGGEERDVSRLTQADKERLKKESEEKEKRDGATLGDILGETRSTQEKLDEIIEQIKNKLVFGVMALVDRFTKGNLFSNSNNTYADMARYGMSQEATEQYNRIRKIKENPNSAESIYSAASKGDKAAMRAMGWFDNTGKYVGSKATTSNEDELEMFKKHFVEAQRAKEKEDREKKAYGGIIRGKGTSKSDSIPAWLSNGEFVVNASATSKHLPELQAMNAEGFSSGTITPIRAGKNQYNLGTSVLPPMSMSNVGVGGVQHVTIDPLQVSGTLTLNVAGGGSKTINANELFTQENVNILLRKLQESLGFRLDKTEFRMPKFM